MAGIESEKWLHSIVKRVEERAKNGDFSDFENLDILDNISSGNLDDLLADFANLTTKEPESMLLNIFLLKRIYEIVESDSVDNSTIKKAVDSMLILRDRGVIL